ncbi:HAD-IIB family hydrolase [Marinimicrobium sp. C6131]|uniref:HAD-IIB family hydrolase n=1 Tax=Marinimicrobium sp. C6131 TaxID=3022676 RepID=UPI00223E7291|nr:HAD-IIB family hydrolase [Marinimicrobium sp. C6131]UZJ46134.1 HAD-IIB family hydrolase [Marinimicrobium sp. C6131]
MNTPMVVFTDLDGTLLNHDDYDWSAAKPALAALKKRRIPLILVSSKTDVEMLELRRALGNTDPLVCENGSLLLIPEDLLEALGVSADPRSISGGYHYEYRGLPREQILTLLNDVKTDYRFTGFAWMTDDDIAQHTGLTLEAAHLASLRKASEPIVWRDTPEALEAFTERLTRHKLRVVKGGRFYHVMGQCDKGDAVRYLQKCYEHHFGAVPFSIALGDSPNDLDMLNAVDAPAIIPHSDGSRLKDPALKRAFVAPEEGAAGWNTAVLTLIDR